MAKLSSLAIDYELSALDSEGGIISYRNIATCDPSQDLYDDVVGKPSDYDILQYIDNLSSGIDHSLPSKNRIFQYSNIENSLACFDERFWRILRFGDGSFGVWYGALNKKTSLKETLSHRPEIDKNDLRNARDPIIQARRMFEATLKPISGRDLTKHTKLHSKLISSDYAFCQTLGTYAIENQIDMYLSPSAQDPTGSCTPVFNPKIISDRPTATYFLVFPLDGSAPFATEKLNF